MARTTNKTNLSANNKELLETVYSATESPVVLESITQTSSQLTSLDSVSLEKYFELHFSTLREKIDKSITDLECLSKEYIKIAENIRNFENEFKNINSEINSLKEKHESLAEFKGSSKTHIWAYNIAIGVIITCLTGSISYYIHTIQPKINQLDTENQLLKSEIEHLKQPITKNQVK